MMGLSLLKIQFQTRAKIFNKHYKINDNFSCKYHSIERMFEQTYNTASFYI